MTDARLRDLERRALADPSNELAIVALDVERERLGIRAPTFQKLAAVLAAVVEKEDVVILERLRAYPLMTGQGVFDSPPLPVTIHDDEGTSMVTLPISEAAAWYGINGDVGGKSFRPPLAVRGLVVVLPPFVEVVALDVCVKGAMWGSRFRSTLHCPRREGGVLLRDGRWVVGIPRPTKIDPSLPPTWWPALLNRLGGIPAPNDSERTTAPLRRSESVPESG